MHSRTIVLLAVLSLTAVACIHLQEPDAEEKLRTTQRLAAVLPLLEELGVHDYRNQDWCRNIDYAGGRFSNNFESSTCNLFERAPVEFTDQANRDFDRVRRALDGVGIGVRIVSVFEATIDENARVIFDVAGGDFDRWSYVYEPGYEGLENIPNEWVETAIDKDWYFVWEDWN